LVSLFVCCLEGQPNSLDLATMDVAAGYFGRMHIVTDTLVSVPFVRTLTYLAGEHSTRAIVDAPLQPGSQADVGEQLLLGPGDVFWTFASLDDTFELEDWSTFSRTSPNGIPASVWPIQ
jgi:hypothetical protein